MAFLIEAYTEDEAPNAKGGVDTRTVLRLDPRLAPVKAAVLPLSRNADLSPKAKDLAAALRKNWNVDFDDAGAIGRRYRRQDEVGTPFCLTVDFDTLEDQAVTDPRARLDEPGAGGPGPVEAYLSRPPPRLLTAGRAGVDGEAAAEGDHLLGLVEVEVRRRPGIVTARRAGRRPACVAAPRRARLQRTGPSRRAGRGPAGASRTRLGGSPRC